MAGRGCGNAQGALADRTDHSTQSNWGAFQCEHIHLDWTIDFSARTLAGAATLTVIAAEEGLARVVLDTRDLSVSGAAVDGHPVAFRLGPVSDVFGAALEVTLPSPLKAGARAEISVRYTTSPDSTALQWLTPEQTAGRRRPFVFSQCQAIHARSMLPCADAPGAKSTYSASVRAPAWATVLMSALAAGGADGKQHVRDVGSGEKVFEWRQPVPTSTYLIAVAAGDLESREISHRCRVWSEPSMVDSVAFEFSQTEDFLSVAEKLAGPYRWTRYDLLCLPPSFPYGGMENPCLTFVTPTLLAGDKSLADVVAHEIAHSWTGNLVTNATWTHFWLNEGWTKWFEQTIMAEVQGDDRNFDLRASLGYEALQASVDHYGHDHPFTCLVPPLQGVDPDDSFSSVPYEKGMNLLFHIQQRVGKPAFLAFFRAYVDTFASKTITTADFHAFVEEYFAKDKAKLAGIDWEAWFLKPGMLPVEPKYDLTLVQAVKELAADFAQGRIDEAKLQQPDYNFNSWPSLRQQLFLQELLDASSESPLPLSTLERMDSLFNLSAKKNSEVRFKWCMLCLRCGRREILRDIASFAVSQGRMKFVRPLYRALLDTKIPGGRELAIGTFAANKDVYHPICRKMVANDISAAVRADRRASEAKNTRETFLRGAGFGVGVAAAAGLLVILTSRALAAK